MCSVHHRLPVPQMYSLRHAVAVMLDCGFTNLNCSSRWSDERITLKCKVFDVSQRQLKRIVKRSFLGLDYYVSTFP